MKIHQYLKKKSAQSASIAISLAFILSIGPTIQHYALSLLNSEVPSVYGSAYKDSLANFPSLSAWVAGAFNWHIPIIATIIAIYSTKEIEPVGIAWRTTLSSFLLLSTCDIAYGAYQNQLNARFLTENLSSNLIGGIITSALLTSILSLADFLYTHTPAGNSSKKIVASISTPLTGLFICCLAYYLASLFYNPLKVKFEAYISTPSSGSILLNEEKESPKSEGKEKPLKFSFLPKESPAKEVSWTGIGELMVKMTPSKNNQPYNISISFLSGCLSADQTEKLPSTTPWLILYGITSLEVSLDHGHTSLFIPDSKNETSKFKTTSSEAILFSLEEDKKTKDIKTTQFVNTDATLEFHNTTGSQTFFLTTPTLKSSDGQAELISRALKVKIDNKEIPFKFDPPANLKSSGSVTCAPIPIIQDKSTTESGTTTIKPASIVVGVLVKVDQAKKEFPIRFDEPKFNATGLTGWISLSRQQPGASEYSQLGSIKILQARGKVSNLTLDGISTPTHSLDTYTAVGDLEATYGDQGNVRVYGFAKMLWRDKDRMNKTHWEKLEWDEKTAIATPLASLLLILLKLIRWRLRTNNRYSWMN